MTKLLINNIKISLDDDESLAISQASKILKRSCPSISDFQLSIHKKSIDARERNNIILVYSILAVTASDISVSSPNIKMLDNDILNVTYGNIQLNHRPLIVGMGPAGMFSALMLAEHGYRPIIIDRGDDVSTRVRALDTFIKTGVLDLESNVQFGAGGAGTFSDGKLTTRINDSKCGYVLSKFVEFGAPEDILIKAKPHIGTDILTNVVSNILNKIEELGGTVIYRCKMTDIETCHNHIVVKTTKGDLITENLVLALGHSARDTYRMIISHNFAVEPKPFSVGVRVEHLQKDIDSALFGQYAGHSKLGVGEYNLSDTKSGRGVYTFCMCPGGEVVPATSQEFGVCVNGMSRYARDGINANCAVNVSVYTDDYGNDPIKAIEFQEELERKAYIAGGGDYYAPIQLMGDFLYGRATTSPSRIIPTYAGGQRTTVTNLANILPTFVSQRLREGFLIFDKRIRGFAVSDAVLTGVETRTSSPIRIMRTDEMTSVKDNRIYPCGEGAGYAGGIMSSAVDGLKVALEIMKKYKP